MAEEYPWSSYPERISGSKISMLDKDSCYTGLADTDRERMRCYRIFVDEGMNLTEKKFIDNSVNRNQLTGNSRFVDEIERKIGFRVERRGRGKP
ncbi:MAG: hypothetical protein ABW148_17530 [Sedimenticola sp.]